MMMAPATPPTYRALPENFLHRPSHHYVLLFLPEYQISEQVASSGAAKPFHGQFRYRTTHNKRKVQIVQIMINSPPPERRRTTEYDAVLRRGD